MKKIVFLTILFILFSCNVFANNITLEEPIISFDKPANYDLQGFTIAKNKLFIVLVNDDDSASIIKIYDLDNGNLFKEMKFDSLGHANDVTYNSNKNVIHVLHAGGSKTISSFDGDSFEYIETFNIDYPARSIAYVDSTNEYIIRNFALSYRLNSNFECINECLFMIIPDIKYETCRQGWAFYDNYLYYATWSWVRQGGDGSNTIKRYDMDGNFIDNIVTDNTIGELEDVSFYNNKMILGFSSYDKSIEFYELDIPKVVIEESLVIEEIKEEKKDNHFYYLIIPFILIIVVLGTVILIKKHKV